MRKLVKGEPLKLRVYFGHSDWINHTDQIGYFKEYETGNYTIRIVWKDNSTSLAPESNILLADDFQLNVRIAIERAVKELT